MYIAQVFLHYNNEELADMVLTYGRANGNDKYSDEFYGEFNYLIVFLLNRS